MSFRATPFSCHIIKAAVDDFSVVVSYDEIKAKNYSLSAGQYFDVKIEYIVEYQQNGADRAEYGAEILKKLSAELSANFGRGFSVDSLELMRRFFTIYHGKRVDSGISGTVSRISLPPYSETVSRKSEIRPTASDEFNGICPTLSGESFFQLMEAFKLSWSHYVVLLTLDDPAERSSYSEEDLETAIIDKLEQFLLELGKGFLFEARQKRFTFDNDHFYVDLVFYNRLLRCYVLIDLKRDKLTHQDLGQMQMYVNHFDRHVKTDDESPAVGIVLCHRKNDALDAKIDLNKQINAELEAMAKTLYDYWFVQFDFPDTNGRPYKSSGGKMVYNEKLKREIPEGWEVGELGDVLSLEYGKPLKEEERSGSGYPVLGSNGVVGYHKEYLIEGSGIVVGRKGTAGAVVWVEDNFYPIDTAFYVKDKIGVNELFFHYLFLLRSSIKQGESSSAVPGLNRNFAHSIKGAIPKKIFIQRFNKFVYPFFAKMKVCSLENQQLTSLRDFLLPMLMNGQVKVV